MCPVPPQTRVAIEAPLDDDASQEGSSKSMDIEQSMATGSAESKTANSSSFGIATAESARVFKLRLLVLLAIFLAAVAVSVVVYLLTSNSEKEEFKNQYEGASLKVMQSFEEIVSKKLTAIGSLAVQASLYASSRNISWPLVTPNDFQLRGAVARELSGALFTRLAPVVTPKTREAWEKYSTENVWWLAEAQAYNEAHGLGFTRRLQEEAAAIDGVADPNVDFSGGIADKIFQFDETFTPVAVSGDGPFFPLWIESPTFGRDITNMDTMSYPDYAPFMIRAYETGEMSIGGLDTAPPGNTSDPDLSSSYFSYLESMKAGKEVMYKGDPMSSVFLPVFDDFEADDREVVGIVFAVFKWAFYFEGLLTANFPGLVVVLENNCDGAFTYRVVGEEAKYMGAGDLHDQYTRRPEMLRSVDFEGIDQRESNSMGMKLNQDICAYKLSVYPSKELEDEYITWLPVLVTLAIAAVFVVTAIVFLIFNQYVEHRQAMVMNQAVKSTALVTSLFPEAVRDRLMDGDFVSGKSRLKSFLNDQGQDNLGPPIAELCKFLSYVLV